MSFTQLAAKFGSPYVASTALGMGLTGYFWYGNLALKYQGVLPYSEKARTTHTQKLDAWTWMFERGKKQMGMSIIVATLAYTTAAILAPAGRLRAPLVVAAGLSASSPIWTLVLMMPTNNRLLELAEKSKADPLVPTAEVDALIARWKALHNARIVLGACAYFTGMAVLLLAM
ncbi:hypothetical protein FRC17_001678 [Serendipita sp. 399]|nr:hypothetical protein FRC17_001678 [Serendipita sp. 399]